jgi:hypothetical protein
MPGSGASGPTADFDIDQGGNDDFDRCHLSGSFDPGDADHLLINTGGSTASIDVATSAGMTVVPGESIEVYTVSFSDTNAPSDVELLTKGYVANDCSFQETSDE